MSIDTTLRPAARVSAIRRLEGCLAVILACLLARWRPQRIRAVLTRLASGQLPASRSEAQRALETVVSVSRRAAGSRGCVVRSLATVLICRRQGSWPAWCIGVRTFGLSDAHAWVEAEGEPVGETPGTAAAYRKIMSVEARGRRGPWLTRLWILG